MNSSKVIQIYDKFRVLKDSLVVYAYFCNYLTNYTVNLKVKSLKCK